MSDATRLDTIEIKLAHLERGLQDLSDVVTRQQRELELALARNQRLAGRLEELEGAGASATAFEKPPHY